LDLSAFGRRGTDTADDERGADADAVLTGESWSLALSHASSSPQSAEEYDGKWEGVLIPTCGLLGGGRWLAFMAIKVEALRTLNLEVTTAQSTDE
jgi:hypothetical protein